MSVYRKIAEVPPEVWDAAAQNQVGFDRALHATCEMIAGNTFVYIVHEEAGGQTLIATAMEIRNPDNINPFADLMLGRLHRSLPTVRSIFSPMIVLRTRFGNDCGIVPGLAVSDRSADRLHEFFIQLEGYADRERLAIAILDIPEGNGLLTRVLVKRGYAGTIGRPVARLHLGWSNWGGYLHAAKQKSASAAATIRHEVNRAEKRHLIISEWDPDTTSEESLREVYDTHFQSKNDRALNYPPLFFTHLRGSIGDRIRVLVAHRRKQLVGSSFLLVGDDRAVVPLGGTHHETDGGAYAYFNLMYYAPIRLALEHKLQVISFGNAAYQAKIRRGCRAEPSYVFWRPHGWAGRKFGGVLTAAHNAVYRRKFRSEFAAREFAMLAD